MKRNAILISLALALGGCAHAGAPSAGASPALSVDELSARSVTIEGMTVTRPDDWSFVLADESLGKFAKLAVSSPRGSDEWAYVSFHRMDLSARDQRLPAPALLKRYSIIALARAGELRVSKEAEALNVAGYSGARMEYDVTEYTLEGESDRRAIVHGIVYGDALWLVHAELPQGDALSEPVATMLSSLELSSRVAL